jgi:anti-sigma regulatory factor (Ser/Thr protein kinase)
VLKLGFDASTLAATRRQVQAFIAEAGAEPGRNDDFLLAASEAMSNSILHGGGGGILRLWAEPTAITGEVQDHGRITGAIDGRPAPSPTQSSGRGLWIINEVCDSVELRHLPDGQIVRFTVHR